MSIYNSSRKEKGVVEAVKVEEFKGITQSILTNLSDQAKVSELLMQINDTYGQKMANLEQLNVKVTEQEGNIKSLQQTNMNLFLKVASPIPAEPIEKPPGEEITYDDLLKDWK